MPSIVGFGTGSANGSVRLGEVVAALSFAADLAMGLPMEHALRSAILTVEIGRRAGLSGADLRDAYFLAMLRQIGCQAEADVVSAVFGDEQAVNAWLSPAQGGSALELLRTAVARIDAGEPPLARARGVVTTLARLPGLNGVAPAHCEVARLVAGRMGFSDRVGRGLEQVYERWDGRGVPRGLAGEAVDRAVRVACFACDLELANAAGGPVEARSRMRARRGRAHDPEVVDVFLSAAGPILGALDVPSIWDSAMSAEPRADEPVGPERLDVALRAFGELVDLRSRFTRGHSDRVAATAAAAGERLGLDDVLTLRRAGWVHNVGMSAVPVSIVEKPGRLSDREFERVRLHSYHTERILMRPPALARVGEIAAAAHERLDGHGYHRRLPRTAIGMPARVLAAADLWHALTADRAHRPALPAEAAAGVLRSGDGLDPEAVSAVLAVVGQPSEPVRARRAAELSDREVEVLGLVARGLTNKEVAQRLSLATKTVGNHLQHIYAKVGVTTRAGAAMFAMEHDLLGR